MKLSKVFDVVTSEQGRRAIGNVMVFSACQRVIDRAADVGGVHKSMAFMESKGFHDRVQKIRESQRFGDVNRRLAEAAEYAAAVHGVVSSCMAIEPVFEVRPQAINSDDEALRALAAVRGKKVEELIAVRQNEADQEFARKVDAVQLAEAEFYAAAGDSDPNVNPTMLINALERSMSNAERKFSATYAAGLCIVLTDESNKLAAIAETEEQQGALGMFNEEAEHKATAPARAPNKPKSKTESKKK